MAIEPGKSKKTYLTLITILTLLTLGLYFFFAKYPANPLENFEAVPNISAEQNPRPVEESPKPVEKNLKFEKKTFGQSAKGRPVEGYEIGGGENAWLMHAAIHGDEIGTADLLNKLAEEILANPKLVATTTKLIIIPIVNPDGYYDRTDKLNANAVNLNLNFETKDWKTYGPEGTFAGLMPFSEPESQILKQIAEQYNPKAMIAFHSQGAIVSPENGHISEALAKWYAKKSGYEYYDNWDYPGTATKWFTQSTGKPAITVEISKQLQNDWEINKAALFEILSFPSTSENLWD